MDQALVDSIRKSLEARSTEEIRQAYERGDQAGRSPEELEAMRQALDERRRKRARLFLAVASAVVIGVLGGAFAWWLLGAGPVVVLAGVACAALGFVSWYIPDIIPRS
jgi:hypothetical protein